MCKASYLSSTEHMNKKIVSLPEIHLVGFSIQTSNQLELSPNTAQIPKMFQIWLGACAALPTLHPNHKTYCVYTAFESDEKGPYTYFIGTPVDTLSAQISQEKMTTPQQTYAQFSQSSAKMPEGIIQAWKKIWQMSDHDFGGKRNFLSDFECYSTQDLLKARPLLSFDICIGIS